MDPHDVDPHVCWMQLRGIGTSKITVYFADIYYHLDILSNVYSMEIGL